VIVAIMPIAIAIAAVVVTAIVVAATVAAVATTVAAAVAVIAVAAACFARAAGCGGAFAADGIAVVRVFLLCDARSGVRFDDNGFPLGVDDALLPDIDVLLATARRRRVSLMPVLLDFHLCGPRKMVNGVQIGGRSRLIADRDAQAAFIDRIIRPVVERCGHDDTVIAWDIINEPEWCLRGGPLFRRTAVSFPALQNFLGEAVQCVKSAARQPVTP
jgi:hypothetical protein